jgi:GMP synthase-like glutamine amidotransferase
MKPVAIFRHSSIEGPGYIAEFLDRHAVLRQLVRIDQGDAVPADATQFSGLVFMGGPMSVNDDLPWLEPTLELIRQAVGRDIPVMGHCLGGQLMAKALGGVVAKNPVKEIGWGEVTVIPGETATAWLGDMRSFDGFHWHGETFSLPSGAVPLLSSRYCANQGFVLGKHLGLQCHVEMTEAMIRSWCENGAGELAASADSPGVQSAATMQAEMAARLPQLHAAADRLYACWLRGVARE